MYTELCAKKDGHETHDRKARRIEERLDFTDVERDQERHRGQELC